jgi:hypothetical protein
MKPSIVLSTIHQWDSSPLVGPARLDEWADVLAFQVGQEGVQAWADRRAANAKPGNVGPMLRGQLDFEWKVPWSERAFAWLQQDPQEVVGDPTDPRYPERLARLYALSDSLASASFWGRKSTDERLPHFGFSFQGRLWGPQVLAEKGPVASEDFQRWATLLTHGVSPDTPLAWMGAAPEPVWQWAARRHLTNRDFVDWGRAHDAPMWEVLERQAYFRALALNDKSHISAESAKVDLFPFRSPYGFGPATRSDEGVPALHVALCRAPGLLRLLKDRNLPASTWAMKNAAGEDAWFAVLRSTNIDRDGRLAGTHVPLLKAAVKPSTDAQGRGWFVADPTILANMARYRGSDDPTGSVAQMPVWKTLLARQPELAWGGSAADHARLAQQLWAPTDAVQDSTPELRSPAAAWRIAPLVGAVPLTAPWLTPELRGAFVVVLAVAIHANETWKREDRWSLSLQQSLEGSLARLVQHPALALPGALDGPSPDVPKSWGALLQGPAGLPLRAALQRQAILEHATAAPSSPSRRGPGRSRG